MIGLVYFVGSLAIIGIFYFINYRKKRPNIYRAENKVKCSCGWVGTQKDLDKTWDWSGPHCPKCGNTGCSMMSNVIDGSKRKWWEE